MSKYGLVACMLILVVQPAIADQKKQPQRPQFVEDISESGGNYFNGLGVPNRSAPSGYKQYCIGGWQQCGYDSARNHSDPNTR
jgi:hypothetical protein